MRFVAPVRVGWFRLSFCVADSDDKDIDIDDERFSSLCMFSPQLACFKRESAPSLI